MSGFFNGQKPPSTILYAPREPVRFSPPGSEAVYVIRQPTHMERARFRAAVTKAGGVSYSALDLLRTLRSETARIMQTFTEENRDATILSELDAHIATVQELLNIWQKSRERSDFDAFLAALEAGTPRLEALRGAVMASSMAFADRVASNQAYGDIASAVAFKKYVVSWEGLEGVPPCDRNDDGVYDQLMDLIPPNHLAAVGLRVRELIDPPEETLKNSGSASSTDSSRPSSTGPSTPSTPTGTTLSLAAPGTPASPAAPTSASIPASS